MLRRRRRPVFRLLCVAPLLGPLSGCIGPEPALGPAPRPVMPAPPDDDALRARIVATATAEWTHWGRQQHGRVFRRGHREHEAAFTARVAEYWRVGTGRELGNVRRAGWSSAFVAWVVDQATEGRGPQFRGPHTTMIHKAVENRRAGHLSARFVGYRVEEMAPVPGDLICNALYRPVSYDRLPPSFASHCDIVVALHPGEVDVIGGNLTNSVSKRTLRRGANGRIRLRQPRAVDPYARRWFVLIRVNP